MNDRAQDIRLANTRLVVAVARSYQGRGLPLDTLVEEGNGVAPRREVRLAAEVSRTRRRGSASRSNTRSGCDGGVTGESAEKFDWRAGHKFSPYAASWIRQSIQHAIARCDGGVTGRQSA